jgi:hypothetical protein
MVDTSGPMARTLEVFIQNLERDCQNLIQVSPATGGLLYFDSRLRRKQT